MNKINITIDGKNIEVDSNSTILEACKKLNIIIPTLCHLDLHDLKMVNKSASCRICVVEVEGRNNLVTACSTPVADGMVVNTHNIRVMNARKTVLELMLSDHPAECLSCSKGGNCDLQHMAERFGMREIRVTGKSQSTYRKDKTVSIRRNLDKCIMCRRCETMCNEVQSVGALSAINRGFDAVVAPTFEVNLHDSVCTFCGQCVQVCPVGALTETDRSWEVIEALANPRKTVVVETAPAVRVALGEEFGYEPGTNVTGKMVSAFRQLGFDYVFDTNFAADLTIMEEATELLERIKRLKNGEKDVNLPMLTSCCPAWVAFIETQFPELLDIPSSVKSPQQILGIIAKTYFAEKINVDRKDMVVVSVMPCLAKKYEAGIESFKEDGNPDVDIVLSTREFAQLIKLSNIDFKSLEDEDFDNPLGESSGAGAIFGTTGGVIEAATRTAVEWITGESLDNVDYKSMRGEEGIRIANLKVKDLELNIGIANGLGSARELLEEIQAGNPRNLHAIEIMACPQGCIDGGGQPYHHGNIDIIKKRKQAIYEVDGKKTIRKSHENPSIQKLYKEYLGEPLGEKSHKLLHREYDKKERV
ncbi:NADH-dependent [FeFe] hydrogenase, group A6 [Mycoplasmatota bacterium zrk1]